MVLVWKHGGIKKPYFKKFNNSYKGKTISDHRRNIVKKLGLPQWVADEIHEMCPRKESFLIARYVRDFAVSKGYCDKTIDSVKKGFYSDFNIKYKMQQRGNVFTPEEFQKIKKDLIELKNSILKV